MTKNILIIGTSSGIGEETAKKLLEDGYEVYSASRKAPNFAVKSHLYFDVLNPDLTIFNQLPAELHGIVYCPGTINLKPFNRLTQNDFLDDFQINFLGAVNVIQANISRLKASGSASVVMFSTVAAQTGMGFHASVAASKGAVEGLTRSLAAEYASLNIRFNAIAPSLTSTPLAQKLLSSPDKIEASNKRHPLNRIGTSNEIAAMTVFLLSENATWMTGQIIKMDGGVGSLKTF